MQLRPLPGTDLQISPIGLGCAGHGGTWDTAPLTDAAVAASLAATRAALDAGLTFFDHADIYCSGKSEEAFSRIWQERPGLRDRVVLQSKVGIRFPDQPPGTPQRFDFSREHILASVDGILRRLQTTWIDLLLLHRPDPLMEPEEIAAAFDTLHAQGKVRWFGVSNQGPWQIELLRRHLGRPLVVNQLQFSLLHSGMLDAGIHVNQARPLPDGGIVEYCRLHGILIQAWAPLANGHATDRAPKSDHRDAARIAACQALVAELAAARGVSRDAIALAWVLRHPARIQPLIGSRNPARIRAAAEAVTVTLTREEWYRLYVAARGERLP